MEREVEAVVVAGQAVLDSSTGHARDPRLRRVFAPRTRLDELDVRHSRPANAEERRPRKERHVEPVRDPRDPTRLQVVAELAVSEIDHGSPARRAVNTVDIGAAGPSEPRYRQTNREISPDRHAAADIERRSVRRLVVHPVALGGIGWRVVQRVVDSPIDGCLRERIHMNESAMESAVLCAARRGPEQQDRQRQGLDRLHRSLPRGAPAPVPASPVHSPNGVGSRRPSRDGGGTSTSALGPGLKGVLSSVA